ncbi:MAG: hypothetical protein ACP5KF_04230 [Sulfurihydrogenibium sp.]
MSCQAFSGLVGNIITDVCCLELEVNNAQVGYSANVLNTTCLGSQTQPIRNQSATYMFLLGNEELAHFLGYSYITYNKHWKQYTNIKKENSTIFKKLEMFIESQNFVNYQSYIPLYVGETDDFQQRYNQFQYTLNNNCNGNHVFGENFCSYLDDLSQANSLRQYSMKMCLVVFYTQTKAQAVYIESSILNQTDPIFNNNKPKFSQPQPFPQIANSIIQTIQNLQSCP